MLLKSKLNISYMPNQLVLINKNSFFMIKKNRKWITKCVIYHKYIVNIILYELFISLFSPIVKKIYLTCKLYSGR